MIALLVAVPTLLLIGLLVNYLYYIPQTNKQHIAAGKDALWNNGGYGFEFSSVTTPGFIISMILVVMILVFTAFLIKHSAKRIVIDRETNTAKVASIGFIAAFFDMMGVGSFASGLAMFKAGNVIKDDKMTPGTLNMSFCAPIMMEASFLVGAISVDILTLVVLVVAAVIGSYIGASLVDKFNAQTIKLVMGSALFIAGIVMILTTPQVALIGAAGGANGIVGWKWAVAVPGFLLIGVLMSFGVGSYAPSILLLSLLGMGLIYIAPIMTCTSAFLMPVTSYKFYKDNNYLPKTSLTTMLGAIFGSTIAFLFFYAGLQGSGVMSADGVAYKSIVKWLTIAVMFYSSITMFIQYFQNRKTAGEKAEAMKKRNKRKSLTKVNKQDLTPTINQQYEKTLDRYSNDLDTKSIVEQENIPMDEWVKNPNSEEDLVSDSVDKVLKDIDTSKPNPKRKTKVEKPEEKKKTN
ncbi:TSUP family transporter [Mesoplasma lactucae]|uniref:Uncharacterized protein n=1 Tax=Mesoplasma lactucae ATCC 49193 TaxID=81460 RepID=A0A291IRA7_9MOLU|nr:TSUP family transporter [Mesoplasma lactucae]ATG97217.1 hypothetical protein CP520_00355 [Mesoplasma lactucae ATCC 49193]ATZ20341.1 hypothetical protein MLACT_v1c05200 [Mesoplasma lactucae ATCC 49193]MCL8216512.1 hypothetical protein [Mesoplasma lactucae ATCC 49193]